MKMEILNNLNNPEILEHMYRADKSRFKRDFEVIFPEIENTLTARIWNARLKSESVEILWGSKEDLLIVSGLALLAGIIAKIPNLLGIDPESFYSRNIAFVFMPVLALFYIQRFKRPVQQWIGSLLIMLLSVFYINILPVNLQSDTFLLVCIHLPLLIWSLVGCIYIGNQWKDYNRQIAFLRYSGDLIVMAGLIFMAGMVLSGVSITLFKLINFDIEEFYIQNIAIWGLAALPVFATYLVETNPQLVHNISPVIARIFTPLVLIMLLIYLIAIIYTGKNPYTDRDFLLIFNLLLVGVMAIILFSISESSEKSSTFSTTLLLALSLVTIVVNGIALSAIIFRISEWGITPNRLAVLGSNLLMIVHLLRVALSLFKALRHPEETARVGRVLVQYLPVYVMWILVVVFLFPLFFGLS